MQGKGIWGLHKTYNRMFGEGTTAGEGRDQDGFGRSICGKTEG